MKIKIYLMLLLSVILLQSCAGSPKIKTVAVPSLMQKVDYDGAVISEKKHTVTLTHYTEFKHIKNKIIFNLLVQNRGRESFSISNENISIEFKGKDEVSAPKKLEIQPLDDFMKDLENDYFNAEVRIVSDTFRSIERTADRIESLIGIDGSISEENMRTIESIADMWASRFLSSADDLEDTIRIYEQFEGIVPPLVFKPQTIIPGRSVSGLIVHDTGDIDDEAEGEFNVIIRVGGEEHRFVFSRSM
jgi:RNase P/RNase MRP subunit p29